MIEIEYKSICELCLKFNTVKECDLPLARNAICSEFNPKYNMAVEDLEKFTGLNYDYLKDDT